MTELDIDMTTKKNKTYAYSRMIIHREDKKIFKSKDIKKVYRAVCKYRKAHPDVICRMTGHYLRNTETDHYDTHIFIEAYNPDYECDSIDYVRTVHKHYRFIRFEVVIEQFAVDLGL